MSMTKTREILHFSKNILRNGLHFSNVTVKLPKTLATSVNGRSIIKAGTVVGRDGSDQNIADASAAYGLVYEDIDVTNEATAYVFGAVTIHGVVEEARLPVAITASAKAALKGAIIFEAGPVKLADNF